MQVLLNEKKELGVFHPILLCVGGGVLSEEISCVSLKQNQMQK
ncbi:hypothetical protein CLOSTMETH_00508 [[Clostridium] methylpentosum DSM 5476]|uniref:Uncharacterized protein n=1 Tax=[Clostridium] methylpentosum DSM 5476 TaxID=537013 RepID=C0E9K9_9FIRM|nr:hypothetical protein CLOSTMETH_00508 [[Clostridium] methylpentosum DSM 5476]